MTLVLHRNAAGETLHSVTLDGRRRRLSTILRTEMPKRPAFVAVQRRGVVPANPDDLIRLRREWASTLVARHDIVIITYLPLGGGGRGGGGGGGKAIGAAVAALALAIVAPYVAGFLSTTVLGLTGTTALIAKSVISLAIVAGASYLLSKATKAKANKTDDRPVYGVSGGGNLPRPGDRIPVNYGRVWVQPDQSQPDYSFYEGDDMVLMKRLTLGAGKYRIHRIRVGQATLWVEGEGLKQPFQNTELEFIVPGENSRLVPSSVYSSENVSGSELPRPDDAVNIMGPFPVCPPNTSVSAIQLDFSCPQCFFTWPKDTQQHAAPWGVEFQYAPIDADSNLIGGWQRLFYSLITERFTRAKRITRIIPVPSGRYAVRGWNLMSLGPQSWIDEGIIHNNAVTWDGLRGFLQHEPLRPHVTEIAMKIRSGKNLGSMTNFSDIWVETTKVLPVWTGAAWTEQPERRAVWAAVDVLRNADYGGGLPDDALDLDRFRHYSDTLGEDDTFDGTIRGPISVVEAASTTLGVIRSEPVRLGAVWSMVRDEPRQIKRHLITRRNIVKDTTGVDFDFDVSDGSSDVIVEYFADGDPRRKGEHRETVGPLTLTPKRINAFGISTHAAAVRLARWYANAAYYRRESRTFTMEMAGRILARNDPANIEAWFLDRTQVAGIVKRSGYSLTLDVDLDYPAKPHCVLRLPTGMEWGPVAIAATEGRKIILDPDDIAAVENTLGIGWSELFRNEDKRLPVTVMVGTVSSLTRPYIIRSAKSDADGKVQVTAVYDAPEVWVALGEAVPLPPPIGEIVAHEGDTTPVLPWIKGIVVQKALAVSLEWSMAPARGCEQYRVDISYDEGHNWECISDGPMVSGSYTVPYWDGGGIRLKGVAFNGNGIPSDPKYATADMLKPTIDDQIANFSIKFNNLVDQLQKELEQVRDSAAGSVRDEINALRDEVDRIAADATLEGAVAYDRSETLAVKLEGRFAAAATRLKLLANNDEVLAQKIDSLIAQVNNDITAAIIAEQTARITAEQVLAQRIDSVTTTVDGHTASLSTVAQSIDGINVQYSVLGTIDNSVGGFILEGARQINGSVTWDMKIKGNMLVTGTVTADKLQVNELSAVTANMGNINAGNIYLAGGRLNILNIGRIEVYD